MPHCTRAVAVSIGLLMLIGNPKAQSAPPSAESPMSDRAEKLKERDRLWTEAEQLHSDGKLAEAIATGRKKLAIEREISAAHDEDVLSSLIWLADVAERAEDWPTAESLRDEALAWSTKHRGADHWQTTNARLALEHVRKKKSLTAAERTDMQRAATLRSEVIRLVDAGEFPEAVAKAIDVCDLSKRLFGENHPDFAQCLNNAAYLYDKVGDYARAEPLYLQVTEIRKRTVGEDHPDYAQSLNNLALLYHIQGDYARSEPLHLQATEIRKRTLGENHHSYGQSLNNLALLYESQGDYARAEPLYRKSIEIHKCALGENNPNYATILNNLAGLYNGVGDYARAEPLYRQSMEIVRRARGENHPDYARIMNNLASLYHDAGDYARSEPLHLQATEIRKRTLGVDHPDYASSLNNLASLYGDIGDYARAEPLYLRTIEIYARTLGVKHPAYAKSLSSLAGLYNGLGDYARAEPLYQQSIAINKHALGESHPDYATSLHNLASLHNRMGDYARAEPLIRQTIEVYKRAFGEIHPYYAMSLSSLAALYVRRGDYARAESLYRQSSQIWKRVFGETHPEYAASLNTLASLLTVLDRADEAEPLYRQSLAISRASLEATAVVLSERQQLTMGRRLRHQLDGYLSLGVSSQTSAPNIFREVLLWKGLTLVRQRGMRLAASDPAVAGLFSQLQRVAGQLASLSRAVPPTEEQQATWRERLTNLTHEKERLEAQLSSKSAAFREATKQISLEDLLDALPQDSVLVDYLEFNRCKPPKEEGKPVTSERELVAFIVHHADKLEDQVVMVSLGPVEPLTAAVERWRTNYGLNETSAAAGLDLRRAIWEPLLPSLGDAKTVLVSTDGVLGRVPLGALPGRKPDTYLIEDHRLAMVPVPQLLPALVSGEGTRELTRELLLLGDVDYDAVSGAASTEVPKKKQPRRAGERSASPSEDKLFDPLANTAGEIAAIEKLFAQLFETKPGDPYSLVKGEADEARFRELAPQYRHLHIATHGFFAGAEYESAAQSRSSDASRDRAMLATAEPTVVGYNPGLLSGLALAGANREPVADADDGILTAQEIGVMNLSGVDTVVLSACDTGLGETAGGEGLLCVQRAFQVAGVRTTVASFWKVDDLVTRMLMERFYRNLWEKEMSRLDALREAQLYILNNPDAIRGSDPQPNDPKLRTSPRYWAAFTLSGDWR